MRLVVYHLNHDTFHKSELKPKKYGLLAFLREEELDILKSVDLSAFLTSV